MDFDQIRPLFGLALLLAVAWALSERRRALPWRAIAVGLAAQLGIAGLLLGVPVLQGALRALNGVVRALSAATEAGTSFVFGYLGGGELPFEPTDPAATYVLAFQALPIVLVMSALSAVLWHWRLLPLVIRGLAWALGRGLRLSGATSLAAAANVFVGMVEAPLLIRPVVQRLSRADLMLIMSVGLATVAGTVIVLYAQFLEGTIDAPLGQILTASVISVPAAALLARIIVPAEGDAAEHPAPDPGSAAAADPDAAAVASPYAGSLDALVRGTEQGLRLLLSIAAMLVVLVALVALLNQVIGLAAVAGAPLTLERLFGWAFAPLVWAIGVPWDQAAAAGRLMGVKTVLNELIAFQQLAGEPGRALDPRSRTVMTYALCGFANPGSLGIMIAGLSGIAPERRDEVLSLAPRAFVAGTLATLMTGAVAALLL
jgi:CNT family concentrative nucleoside transporter